MRQNLFTIAPHAPFLATLADRILDGTLLGGWPRTGPFWLSDITIFLPTRRARLALIDIFAARLGGAALLPVIRTLGEEDEVQAAFFDGAVPDVTAAHPLARQLVLARLVEAWVATEERGGDTGFASPPSPAEIVALAGSLGRLVDDFEIEEIDPEGLAAAIPDEFAENWRRTLRFLAIALAAWPAHLKETGSADFARLRRLRLDHETRNLSEIHADRPVIAAGSTGSIKATARLIAGIAGLPRGAVVLPGLDTGLSPDAVVALADPATNPHAHPQYGLVKLLGLLGAGPGDVAELAAPGATRTVIVRHALALAAATPEWGRQRAAISKKTLDAATAGLSLLIAPTQHEEARAIAVAAHRALLDKRSVGIVSPDRHLARRIVHELARFGIEIEDSAGIPLAQSRAARLLRQAVLVVTGGWAPVDLTALLANRNVTLGIGRAGIAPRLELLELAALRGQRPAGGLAGIRRRLTLNAAGQADHPAHQLTAAELEQVSELLDALETALEPVAQTVAAPGIELASLAPAMAVALDRLRSPTAGEPDTGRPALEGEVELADWLTLLEQAPLATRLSSGGLLSALVALMADASVPPARPGRSDIAIWGRIEARLQSADLLIAAGLNEDVWPGPADSGPWLNRTMRLAAGLEAPERRVGLAAHDFEMALGGAEVLMTRSARIGTSPADPSRFLQRLTAFLGENRATELVARGNRWLELATALDHVETPRPVARPVPKPPASLRPRRLSVTEIETLIRDPYAIYARHVLGLSQLEALGEMPDAAARGRLIHDILGRFISQGGDPLAADAPETLQQMAATAFAELGDIADRARLWQARFSAIAAAFIDWERTRAFKVVSRHAEISGQATLPVESQDFRLRGRADRVDVLTGGGLEIVDFKTGAVPTKSQITQRLAPQLPMEALIARHGGFSSIAGAEAEALTYVKFAHGPAPIDFRDFSIEGLTLAEAIDDHWRRVSQHISLFLLSGTHPMHPHLLPATGRRYPGPYDHLARLGEWSIGAGEEP